ncbi:acyltransferase family protein, partial [Achromobacter ruhlandii]
MSTKYQPGIDALRAVAVLAVLLFHLDLPWAAGGFVGVDVFFVISGYLITQSIIDEGPRFSLWNFYRRRFMRLYPALIATIGMVLVAGYLLTDPATFKETARSSIWASLSA